MGAATVISAFLGILTLIALIASAVAVLFATRSKVIIENLRGDRDDQEKRIVRLERELTDSQTTAARLEAENITLRSMKDATAAVEKLAEALTHIDTARQQEHHDMSALMTALGGAATAGHEEVLELIRTTCHSHAA